MKVLFKAGTILVSLLLPFTVLGQHGGQFVIDGKINSDTVVSGKIFLQYTDNDNEMRDSVTIVNNAYHFEGKTYDGAIAANLFCYPTYKGIRAANAMFNGFLRLYIEPGRVTISHQRNFNSAEIDGSSIQRDVEKIHSEEQAHLTPDTLIHAKYIASHPDSWLSYLLLDEMVRFKKINYATSRPLYDRLSPDLKNYTQVSAINILINSDQNVGIGKQALLFTENDAHGKIVSLENFRGKYVLVDFWASWCHPCRAENPVIKKAYEKYKNKGFDVLGVSLDAVREQWLNALKQDNLVWTEVCNLKGFRDEVVLKYGITSIPRNFLIDPSGKIIAMDLRGDQLESRLAMLFKKNQ